MKRIIGKVFIIAGILIISSVVYMNYTTSENNNTLVTQYKSNIKATEQDSQIEVLENVIGILDIPKINLEVAVKEGTDKETLKYAVGHFEETAMPGEYGNFSVAGHRAYTTNKFFSNLDKLEIGDELNMLYMDTTHSYKVNSIEVVEPEEVEVVDSTNKDKKEITLVTCTPKYVGSHRLVVKGEYVQ